MEKEIGGTLVWYYVMCPRQVWLLAHNILPDQTDQNLQIGRMIDEWSYPRQRRRGVNVDNALVIDILEGEGVVAEVKKSSASLEAARMQLAYYLYYLKHRKGIETTGMLLIPEERRRYRLELTPEMEAQLEHILAQIDKVRALERPMPPRKNRRCRRCAYAPVCWG